MDSNLLKEAIADAKAVRQTALANAKVALEEVFSERYQAMFAEKLKEEAEQEACAPAEESAAPAEESVSEQEINELIAELEAEVGGGEQGTEGGEENPAAQTPAPAASVPQTAPPMPGAVPQGCPPMGGAPMGGSPMPPMGGEMGAPAPMPGAPAPMPGAPAPMPGAPAPMGGEMGAPSAPAAGTTPPPSDVPQTEDEGMNEEEVDLDALLESLKEEVEMGDEEEEEEGKLDEQTKLTSSGIGGSKAGGSANKSPASGTKSSSRIETGGADKDGMPTIDQPKVVAKEATQAGRPNQAKNATKTNLSTPSMGKGNAGGGQTEDGMPKLGQAKQTAKEPTLASRPNQAKNATKDNLSTPGGALQENQSLRKQLNEAEEVIKYVKGQLNEVNLLNAKLLYTNKLFKEYNMNNEQKMRVVEMFDLSKNVREVKLTYANIAESLSFSGNNMKKAKTSANVQSITEGLASGAVGSTKPSKQIISEGTASQMVSKFQKLAGIKKS